jgi:hypothetical protein
METKLKILGFAGSLLETRNRVTQACKAQNRRPLGSR